MTAELANGPAAAAARDVKLITCILPKGVGRKLVKELHNRSYTTANVFNARGSDHGDPIGKSGLPDQVEKDILTVVVGSAEADEVFAFIFEEAEINRVGGGFMFQTSLRKSSAFILPDVPPEEDSAG